MSNQPVAGVNPVVVPVRLDSNCGPGATEALWNTMMTAMQSNGPVTVEVDASQVEQLGIGCLQVLVAAAQELHNRKGALVVASSSAAWAEWVRLSGTPGLSGGRDDRGQNT